MTIERSRPGTEHGEQPEHDYLLVETEDGSEYLVESSDASGAGVVAVVREDARGFFCYPDSSPHPRLGPFGSVNEALAALQDFAQGDHDRGEHGGA